jgi:hypothetical protein
LTFLLLLVAVAAVVVAAVVQGVTLQAMTFYLSWPQIIQLR